MKIVGLVGGIGPESTIEYYRLLLAASRSRLRGGGNPPVLIDSIDVAKMLGLIEKGELEAVTDYLSDELARLVRAGAEVGALAANTPHIVFDELQRRCPIPLVSIVEATAAAAADRKLARVGIFGTRFTMQAPFYPSVLARRGIAVIAPAAEEQAFIHEKYVGELLQGILAPETRRLLLTIAARMREREGVGAIILGGTELPLLLRESPGGAVPFLDTTTIHVEAIVTAMLSEAPLGG